jgi:hypothetical protein
MPRDFLVIGFLGVLAAGCDSSSDEDDTGLSGDPLDCAWLASNNCWKTTVAAAAGCVPPESEAGVLSADGSACVYTSGASVAFHDPVVLPVDLDAETNWNFTQSRAGAPCVTFNGVEGEAQVLTVQGLTYREETVGFGLQVTCPDGSQFATGNAFALLECSNFFEDAPGYAWGSTDASVSFSLIHGAAGDVGVFNCAR